MTKFKEVLYTMQIINIILQILIILLPVGIISDIIYTHIKEKKNERDFRKRQEKYKKMI